MAILHTIGLALQLPGLALPKGKAVLPGFRTMLRAALTRRQLAEMDDRMLRDIGISRVDALAEAERVPWDLR